MRETPAERAMLRMAVENTLANWIRNVITIIALGLVVYNMNHHVSTRKMTLLMIVVGLVMGITALVVYIHRVNEILTTGYVETHIKHMEYLSYVLIASIVAFFIGTAILMIQI